MCSRRRTRSESSSKSLTVTNTPAIVADIVKVKIRDKTLFKCLKCDRLQERRFNAERHYKRLHEIIQARKCCKKTFYTKSDYYDHKEDVHNEWKRYGRIRKEETQSSDSSTKSNKEINKYGDSVLDVKSQISTSVKIAKERRSEKCVDTNNVHHVQDNVTDSDSNNKEKSKNNMCHSRQSAKSPKKIFIYRMQEELNRRRNSVPLRSIENFTEKSLNKTSRENAVQNTVKVSSSADKGNVIIYDYTATSVLDLMQLMRNTIDF